MPLTAHHPKILLPLLAACMFPLRLLAGGGDTTGGVSLLLHGTEYVKSFNSGNGDPFFPATRNTGRIRYRDNWFEDVEMLYDCEDDVLIVRDQEGQMKLRLVPEKLDAFVIEGHEFVRLRLLTANGEFYERIFRGRRQLLVQWQKRKVTNNRETDKYQLSRSIFVLDQGKVINLESAGDLTRIAPGHGKEVKRMMATSRIRFKKDPVGLCLHVVKEIENKGW